MARDTKDETMVSFLIPNQILEEVDGIREKEGQATRSSIFRRMVNSGLKNYDRLETTPGILTTPQF